MRRGLIEVPTRKRFRFAREPSPRILAAEEIIIQKPTAANFLGHDACGLSVRGSATDYAVPRDTTSSAPLATHTI